MVHSLVDRAEMYVRSSGTGSLAAHDDDNNKDDRLRSLGENNSLLVFKEMLVCPSSSSAPLVCSVCCSLKGREMTNMGL